MPLTDTALRNLKPNGTPTKLTDSEGLYLYLSPSGGKLWRLDSKGGQSGDLMGAIRHRRNGIFLRVVRKNVRDDRPFF